MLSGVRASGPRETTAAIGQEQKNIMCISQLIALLRHLCPRRRLHRLLASVDATRVWQAGAVVAVLLLKALPILQKWRWLGADLALEVLWLEESAVKLV